MQDAGKRQPFDATGWNEVRSPAGAVCCELGDADVVASV